MAGAIVGLSERSRRAALQRILALQLSARDRDELASAVERLGLLEGEVYGLERRKGGSHALIMKTNLNRPSE